jgi:hypothetical protein
MTAARARDAILFISFLQKQSAAKSDTLYAPQSHAGEVGTAMRPDYRAVRGKQVTKIKAFPRMRDWRRFEAESLRIC